jgi:hypothetical protein
MLFLKIFLSIIGILIALIISLLISASITGRDRRAYAVVSPETSIEVNRNSMSTSKLASIYQPKVYLRKTNASPALKWTWYEVIPGEKTIDIVYYQNWENEINPDQTMSTLYSIFRAAYYGYPLYDIEFFQVRISKSSGKVEGLLFETSPGDDYYVTFSEHLVARYELRSDGQFTKILEKKNSGEVISQSVDQANFDGDHVLVLAQTWNHLSRLLSSSDVDVNYLESGLKFLTDADYSRYKFVRKSQGDHKTKGSIGTLVFGTIAIYALLTLPLILFRLAKRRRGSLDA